MFRAMVLAAVMVLSVVTGPIAAAGSSAVGNHVGNEVGNEAGNQAGDTDAEVDPGSAKPMTISWFRSQSDANGPYPVLPNEYEDDETGISMFTNAEGDAELRVDNTTAQNPNGQWDMLTLHVEVDSLEELDPPTEGADKGLVTQEFIENDAWDVEIEQTNGDKTLNVADNQEGYENPAGVDADVPPVMVFADTEEIDSDFTVGSEPDTGLFVWVDPNRAVLEENGEETSFEPGDEFEATFDIGPFGESTEFEMVEGDVELGDDIEPANTVGETVSGQTTMAGGSDLQIVVETEDGEIQTQTTAVEGDQVLMDSDSAATAPWGFVNGTFDFTEREGQEFSVDVYAPGPEGGMLDGEPSRDDDEYLSEENRIHVASGSGTVQDIIDPEYTIPNASVDNGKPLTIGYGVDEVQYGEETAAGVGEMVGDGEIGYDEYVAYDSQGTNAWDGLFLHYETSDSVFEAINRAPGANIVDKVENSDLSFEVTQTGADDPKELDLSQNASGVHIIPDPSMSDARLYDGDETDGIFLWLDLNEVQLYQDGEATEAEPGETYESTLTIETEERTVEETIEFETIEGETYFANRNDDGQVELAQSENAEVRLVSQLAAGLEWNVGVNNSEAGVDVFEQGLENTGDGNVLAGKIAGSRPDSSVSLTVDTSDLEQDTELSLTAELSEDPPDAPVTITETTAVIVPPPTASVSMSDQSGDGETVVVDELETSDGGFVSIHTGSANGPTIGNTGFLEAGTHSDVEVDLDEPLSDDETVYALVHEDSNNNGEFDYPADDGAYTDDAGESVSASASYTVESGPTPTETDTGPTPTDTDAGSGPTATDTDEPQTPGATTETDSDSGPGFGPVVAIVALIAAALIAIRRND